MAIKVGLVGLPNVGKSTLFNALTNAEVAAENYPFCTIDPHIAVTQVPDKRLKVLTKIFSSAKTIHAIVQFADIAGLVKGASKGEGLGNQFLSHIMEVDLILHVIRCFEDPDVQHVHNTIDPIDDFETITAELMLKDLESIQKKEIKITSVLAKAKSKQLTSSQIKELKLEQELITKAKNLLNKGDYKNLQKLVLNYKKEHDIQTIPLLSAKKFLIIANLSEDDFANQNYKNNNFYKKLIEEFGENVVIPVSAKIEAELSQLDSEEQKEMFESLQIKESGLENIIKKSYINLGLITFFTCGPKESHAWSIKKGITIQQAAGEIHSDMERGFICSEIYNCKDLFELKNEHALKIAGKIRTEGKSYIVQDGDIILVRFNV